MEDERDDEAEQEERYDQDQEEEEDDEGEDTESVKTYVKSIIPFDADDDDHKRSPHATSSPKGNITIMLHIIQSYCCTILYYIMLPTMKYILFIYANLLFANDYCNPNQFKMSKQTNGFN